MENVLQKSVSYREGVAKKSTLARREIVCGELPQDFNDKTRLPLVKKLDMVKRLETAGIRTNVRNLSHDLDLLRGAFRLCYGTKEDRVGILKRLLGKNDPITTPLLCLIKDGVVALAPEERALIPEELVRGAGVGRKKGRKAQSTKPRAKKMAPPDELVPEEVLEKDVEKTLDSLLARHNESLLVERSFMEGMVLAIKRSGEEILDLVGEKEKLKSRIQALENEVAKLNRSMARMAQWMLLKKVRNSEDLFQQFPEMLTFRDIIEERLSKSSKGQKINLPGGGMYLGEARFRYLYDDKFSKCLDELPPPKQKNVERALEKFKNFGASHKSLKSRPAPVVTDDMPKNSFIISIDDNLRLVCVVFEEEKRVLFFKIAPHNEIWKSEG